MKLPSVSAFNEGTWLTQLRCSQRRELSGDHVAKLLSARGRCHAAQRCARCLAYPLARSSGKGEGGRVAGTAGTVSQVRKAKKDKKEKKDALREVPLAANFEVA